MKLSKKRIRIIFLSVAWAVMFYHKGHKGIHKEEYTKKNTQRIHETGWMYRMEV